MSSQFLQTELANLIHESRRKNADLRTVSSSLLGHLPRPDIDQKIQAAEQSLNELKALPSTSEAQISAGKPVKFVTELQVG